MKRALVHVELFLCLVAGALLVVPIFVGGYADDAFCYIRDYSDRLADVLDTARR